MTTTPETPDAAALLARQSALQSAASAVLADLDLLGTLGRVGRPIVVGSVALGLMVWRDIDLTTICPVLDPDQLFVLVRPLASHPRIARLECRIEIGPYNRDPALPDGLYWGLHYRADDRATWQLDLWFLREGTRQGDLDHLETLPARLTPETRLAILWIKGLWAQLPAYRTQVRSVDIYDAVLDHGVRTPNEFRAFLEGRDRPS